MLRLFNEHRVRRSESLDGAWSFCTDKNDIGKTESWQRAIPSPETVCVPQVWGSEMGLLKYEGVAWYEKKFYTQGGTLRIVFGAVMTEAEVYFDGEMVGYHYGGYSQFDVILNDVSAGEHRLTVRVDNRFTAQSIPQRVVDWYHHGGITRGVTLETLEGICVLGNSFEYTLSDDMTSAVCRPVVELYNTKKRKAETKLSLSVGGEEKLCETVAVGGRKRATVALSEFVLENVRLWDVLKSELYTVEYKTETDDLFDRVGFRRVEVVGSEVRLNGKAVEFRGVNRHEEHPDWGFAFPMGLMKKDIDLALEMGCNALRGSHYPNSQVFVDWLDEKGIMFWSEIPIWGCGFSTAALGDKTVVERGLDMHREMVKYYYNHPCIIMWGMHNEINVETKEAYKMTECYYKFLKENGGNRLVVYASHRPFVDICMEMCDVICLNQYYGWYSSYDADAWENFLQKFGEKKAELGLSGKPVIMSEFGGAGLYGYRDNEQTIWSEDYQASLIKHCLELFHDEPEFVGMFIWQFIDTRTCLDMGLNRARCFNNKGIVNENRKPKMAYYAAKECYDRFAAESSDR